MVMPPLAAMAPARNGGRAKTADHDFAIAKERAFGHDGMNARAGHGGIAAMESAMDETAQLRVDITVLRARVDALQTDLMELLALHGQTLEALAQVAGKWPRAHQAFGSGA
jgi:hypothetical protein